MMFAAESAAAAATVLVVTSVAIFLHLSSSLIHQHDTGGVLHVIKEFLAAQSTPSPDALAFLSLVRTLQRQLPLQELQVMREVHAAAVQEKLLAFQAKKDAIKEAATVSLQSKPLPPTYSSSSSRFKRFLGSSALKKAPTLFGKKRQDHTEDSSEKSRVADEFDDVGREGADGDSDLLHSQLQHTTYLLEGDAIDAVECAQIKERIVHTWSSARHTPAHAQTRVDLLKASLFVSPQSHGQPTPSSSSKAQSLVSRHTARARASLHALGVKWRSRSPSKPSDIVSSTKKTPLSPTALQLSEIAESYYGGDITKDQSIRRKTDLIAKSMFPDDDKTSQCPT
ncbi:hypothetical protein DYB32_003866 [Aphanomyces invadans]|uniref:Uncharacterized protein n=1 Tax=Aphanomyces invadans TaxID=157072 RepID=A0A418B6U8_9STRA|nr:hypothetical protein DYB32_003866 [Aphanomyces invadans]